MSKNIKKFKSDLLSWLKRETNVIIYPENENSLYVSMPIQNMRGENINVFVEVINDMVYISDLGNTISNVYISPEKMKALEIYLQSKIGSINITDGFVLGKVQINKIMPFFTSYVNALTVIEAFAIL